MDSADDRLDTLTYHGVWQGVAASGLYSPFWFSATSDGTVPIAPLSTSLRGGIEKEAVRHARWWDYSYGIDILGIGALESYWRTLDIISLKPALTPRIVKLYAHARLWCFDLTVGWKPVDWGNQDYGLTSGGMLLSHNAPTMPRVTIGIDRYTPIPFTYGYLEVKGNITHGWFTDGNGVKGALLHYKHIGIRIGGNLPVNINYEFHHAAQWGGVSDVYGRLGSSLSNWWNIFRAKAGGVMGNDQINAEGNHLGAQMLGVDVKWDGWKIKAYWQNIFEDGPIRFIFSTMNISDGLWGLSIRQSKWPYISGVLYEFLGTTDQSGPVHDIDGIIFGGGDGYFSNSIYTQGWNHYRMTMGTPFVTSPAYNTDGSLRSYNDRTFTHHIAIQGDIYGFKYLARYSHSTNFGTYSRPVVPVAVNAALLHVEKQVPRAWNLNFGASIGIDTEDGTLRSFGVMLTVAKRGIAWFSKR